MTIQTPTAETPAMTRREAYDTMIQKACALLDLSSELAKHHEKRLALEDAMPSFDSVSSFEELEAKEEKSAQLKPQIQNHSDRINDIQVEMRDLKEAIRSIILNYNFARVNHIVFEHNKDRWNIAVTKIVRTSTSSNHIVFEVEEYAS